MDTGTKEADRDQDRQEEISPRLKQPGLPKLLVAAVLVKATELPNRLGPGLQTVSALVIRILASTSRFLRRKTRRASAWFINLGWPLMAAGFLAFGRVVRGLAFWGFRSARRRVLWLTPRAARVARILAVQIGGALWLALLFWADAASSILVIGARLFAALVRALLTGTARTIVLFVTGLVWLVTNIPNGLRWLAGVRLGDLVAFPFWLARRGVSAAGGGKLAFWRPERFRTERSRLRARGVFALSVLVAANGVFYTGFSVMDLNAEQPKTASRVLGVKLVSLPERSRILARDGTEMAVLFKDENRQVIDLFEIAPVMVETTVAVEDRRFYRHHGFDLRGTMRAVVKNLLEGKALEGGSTITQQYVRSVYLENARTIPRKFREIMLAIQLEQRYTKDAILEAYLNRAYFGEGNYGVQAAAESYLGSDASSLKPDQAALLVSLLRAPNSGSPFADPEETLRRRNMVLDQMAEAKIISPVERDELVQRPLEVRDPEKTDEIKMAPHFVEFIKRRLLQDRRLGSTYRERYRAVFSGGLTVVTSLDPRMQAAASSAVAKLPKGVPEAAAVIMDPNRGDILAYQGGSDFDARKFDLVSQGRRQPGSAFKTFALVAALSSNYSPNLPLGGDSPCEFELPTTQPWKVENFGGHSYGTVSLKDATAKSINCAYADLMINHLDPREVVATARSMGIDSPLDPYPSIALGGLTNGVTPLEMTRAFGTLAAEGERPQVRPIIEVRNRSGDRIIREDPESERVMPPNVARMATSILTEVVQTGTAIDAKSVERPAAGKTGTTQSNRDAWFIGYTPDAVGAVWLGHPDAQVEMRGVTGGSVAAGIWGQIMLEVHQGIEPQDFTQPYAEEFFRLPNASVTQTVQSRDFEPLERPKLRRRHRD